MRRTGHDDAGDPTFAEPLGILLDALAADRGLNFTGRLAASSLVRSLLEQRLQLEDLLRAHPEISARPVAAPLVIIGLPRSGTTLLQFLLAADPANRALLHWEATQPFPVPERLTFETDPRIREVERTFRLVDYLAPQARVIHPLAADRPTECVTLLARSFASLEFAATYGVDEHLSWFLEADLRPHYADMRRQLQALQWHTERDRWLLKCPAHMFALDALLDAFPDARIVQLHRDPAKVVPSYCSLVSVLQGVTHDRVDLEAIGRRWAPLWTEALERTTRVRDAIDDRSFFDLQYRELVADPLGAVERIYEHFALPLTDHARNEMVTTLERQRQYGEGRHRYTPDQFGLRAESERARAAAYITRFDVELEP